MYIQIKQIEKQLKTTPVIILLIFFSTSGVQAQADSIPGRKQGSEGIRLFALPAKDDFRYPVFNSRLPFDMNLFRPKEKNNGAFLLVYREEKIEKTIVQILGMGVLTLLGNNYDYQRPLLQTSVGHPYFITNR